MALQVWLPLLGDLTNNGIYNSTISNVNATITNSGKLGKCYTTNGSNAYITGTYTATVNMSFCIWVKFNSSFAGHLIDARVDDVGYQPMYIESNRLQTGGSTGGYPNFYYAFSTDIWYHLCVIYTQNNVSLYVNGSLVGTSTGGKGYDYGSKEFTLCCRHSHNQYYIPANIQDFRIYDHALSPKEVELLARGLVLHYPMTGGGRGGENIITDTSPNEVQYTYPASGSSDRFFKTSTIVPSASQYILSFWAKSTHAGDKVRAHWHGPNTTTKSETNQGETTVATDGRIDFTLSDKWEKYWCIWTQSSTTAVKHFIFPRMFSQEKGQATGTGTVSVKCVKLEEGNIPTPWIPNSADTAYTSMGYNSTTEYDVSGYNYHGTKIGSSTYSSDTPRYSTSTSFNGVDNCIQVPLNTFFPNAGSFTINLWFKKHEIGSKNYETVFGGISGFEMDTRNGGNTTLSYYVTGNNRGFTIQSPLNFDTWYMLTMVCDGTNELYYLNGEYKKQFEKKGMPTGNYFIGAWRDSVSQNFKGLISDFRVYATALTATQIKEIYNTSASISNNGTLLGYEFVET